jgi:hypothetical protein
VTHPSSKQARPELERVIAGASNRPNAERLERPVIWSGVAFGILLLVGWFLSAGDTPDYTAADQDWVSWATENSSRSGIGAFVVLFAGCAFLHFAGTVREVLGSEESRLRGTAQLARTAFAGGVTGIVGITMAIVMIGAATSVGADADPLVSRAVGTASAGPYLVATMGFATMLGASGVLTLRTGVFARWTGMVALLGAVAFLITFITLIDGTGEDSVFGYGYLPGILALVVWAIATSAANHRLPQAGHPGG